MNEPRKENPVRKVMNEKEAILNKLRKKGCRITKQRKTVIDIVLENDCSCCKEIFYQAVKSDPKIGIATVYRMIKTLEDIGAINRKNQYKVSMDETQMDSDNCKCDEGCMIVLKNNRMLKLNPKEFSDALKAGLDMIGITIEDEIDSILL